MRPKPTLLVLATLVCSILSGVADELKIADPFGSAMVLQRNQPVPVWGTGAAGATVTIQFADQTQTTTVNAQGCWELRLGPLSASAENRSFTVSSGEEKIVLQDVLVGEVWLCSGQSNMEFGLNAFPFGPGEIKKGNHPLLRLRYSDKVTAATPLSQIKGSPWMVCTPANLKRGTRQNSFSALAYLFGAELHRQLNVPVGIIQSAWGGTRIEPWTSQDGFRVVPGLQSFIHSTPPEKPSRGTSSALYNAMIHPWIPYAIRGVIWYQGETNRHDGALYSDKMEALIQGWRAAWKQGDFPFYYVQLAPFRYTARPADRSRMDKYGLPKIWAAQTAALRIPNTGMAIINDVGNPNDIHPAKKKPVAERLVRLALSRTYGAKFPDDSGPIFKSATREKNTVVIAFDHANSGLISRNNQPLTFFELAGSDEQFFAAQAVIQDGKVVVSSREVPEPRYVRFAWQEDASPNLANGERLPASAFSATVP